MKTTISRVFRFLAGGSVLAAAAVAVPGSADAAAYSVTSSFGRCTPNSSPQSYIDGGNDLAANTLILNCPVTDSTDIPRGSLSTLALFYEDRTDTASVWAARCVEYENLAGGVCGDFVKSSVSGIGVGNLQPPNTPASFASSWNAGHFGYVMVFLPSKSATGGVSRVKGLYEKKL